MEKLDCLVIGAGVNGLCTANSLARRGKRVLVLEQFPLPHTRGSSHGESRIIRLIHVEPWFAAMMPDAYRQWAELQEQTKTQLIVPTGGVYFEGPPYAVLQKADALLGSSGIEYEKWSPEEVRQKFPTIQSDTPYFGVWEKTAGILKADKCIAAVKDAFLANDGTIRDGEEVKEIVPGPVVMVKTSKGSYQAQKLIVTAGPWTNKVLETTGLQLPLKVHRVKVFYWKADPEVYNHSKFPVFVFLGAAPEGKEISELFGLTAMEHPDMIKVCLHGGEEIDPDQKDVPDDKDWDIQYLKSFVTSHFKSVESSPSITENCMYTNTPDRNFILDVHPKHSNIIIGAGFSGTGFKMAPVVGDILADMSEGNEPKHDLTAFKLTRFSEGGK